jgi:hypothetical protein
MFVLYGLQVISIADLTSGMSSLHKFPSGQLKIKGKELHFRSRQTEKR